MIPESEGAALTKRAIVINSQPNLERKIVVAQFLVGIILAVVASVHSNQASTAFFLGAWIQASGSAWVAFRLARLPMSAPAEKVLAAFFVAGLSKWLIMGGLFFISFKQLAWLRDWPYVGLFFAAFIAAQSLGWICPIICRPSTPNKASGLS
jgi:F0F1-type ATP synthase assembly protein I